MHRVTLWLRGIVTLGGLFALVLTMSASPASATVNVLIMPDYDALQGNTVVVWGNTQFPNTTSTFVINFGDGSATVPAPVTDRSFIATTHVYNTAGVFTASLKVTPQGGTPEEETTTIQVFNPAALSNVLTRAVRINQTIENGKRWLYVNQDSRATKFALNTTSWARDRGDLSFNLAYTSLIVLSLENQGHLVGNDPTHDIFQAVVQRGINYLADNVQRQTLTVEPAGDPCVGVPNDANKCLGLASGGSRPGYATSIVALAFAGSNAPSQTVPAGLGTGASSGLGGAGNTGFVAGKTYKEILQRIVNTIVWGQADAGGGATNRGGFRYGLDDFQSDGSAIGWAVLALFDAQSFGTTVPAFVKTELAMVIQNTSCPQPSGNLSNGLSYTGCGSGNLLKTGIALQALNLLGVPVSDIRVQNALTYISDRWNQVINEDGFSCGNPSSLGAGSPPGSANNKGCAYAMYQAFKGLQLYNIATLPGVNRIANPLGMPRVGKQPQPLPPYDPIDDYLEDYRDYLVANQQNPTTTAGGNWGSPQMGWSCCDTDNRGITALAELILSPVGIVLPSGLALAPAMATNLAGSDHTVTATATTAGGGVVPAASVKFEVLSGPNKGVTGNMVTDPNGQASFTYTGAKGIGTDQIQASIATGGGDVLSNIVQKVWTFTPTGGIIRTPLRNFKLTLVRPRPDATGVRCVETDNPNNPDFDALPFTPFPANGTVNLAILLSDGAGTKTVCCEFLTTAQAIIGPAGFCSDIDLAPDDLQARPKTGKVDLTWTPSEGADSYNVLRSLTKGGPYQTIGTSTNGIFADFTATAGQTFFYAVQAVGSGETANSNEVQVIVPKARLR